MSPSTCCRPLAVCRTAPAARQVFPLSAVSLPVVSGKISLPQSSLLPSPSTVRLGALRLRTVKAGNWSAVTCTLATDPKVTIDNSTVLVVGGGGVGMEVVRQLSRAGSWVTAFQRGEKFRPEIEQLGAMLAVGDVMNVATIRKALSLNTYDAIVSTVGGGITDIQVDSEGNINLIQAAIEAKIPRFLLVSSIGAGTSACALGPKQMEVLGKVLKEKEKAEQRLMESSLQWTIIRPGGLLTEPVSGNGILSEDPRVVGSIARSDVAALVSKALFRDDCNGKVFSAIDKNRKIPGVPEIDYKVFEL